MKAKGKPIDKGKLIIAVLIPLIAGFIGGFFTFASVNDWYATINKPSFNPPSWVFGPAWTILYILMGVSLYLVWIKGIESRRAKIAVILFAFQLFLNVLWSLLFFGLRSPYYAYLEINFLWVSILITMIAFYHVSKKAAYLMVPYILWVSFATILNFFVFMLNM